MTTKFGSYINHFTGTSVRDCKYNTVEREIDESLKRLQTDYIDFYVMHWPDVNTPIEETMAAINMLKEKRQDPVYRDVQLSERADHGSAEICKDRCDSAAVFYGKSDGERADGMGGDSGIGTMTYGSLGAGILTGAIRECPEYDPKDMRLVFYPFFKEPTFSKIMELLKTLDAIAEEHESRWHRFRLTGVHRKAL